MNAISDRKVQRTLCLSDLHLGRVTTYAHAPEVIAPLVEGFDRVLLLGDIIDHWYTHPAQALELEQRIKAVCRAGGAKEVMLFRGNHDACTEEAEEFALLDKILYLHGHAVYHKLKGNGCPSTRIKALNTQKFGTFRMGSRHGHHVWKVVDRLYGAIPMAMMMPVAWPWPVVRRIRALAHEVAPPGAIHGVVLGHSHRPGVRHIDGLTLFNLGGWMKNTRAYGFVREDNEIRLVHIDNRAHKLKWGEVLHRSSLG